MNRSPEQTVEEASGVAVSDRQLLSVFVDHNDERAFAELVSRYCGLVLGVCRRVLRDEHIAEDAFQATFLVMARRATQIRNRSSLASWLYAVAYRTARRANAKKHRRREESLQNEIMDPSDTLAQVADRYEQQLLDEELNQLPHKYREPLVLHYLMGKTNREVADELGVSVGVIEGRVKRGKERLRIGLLRRGIELSIALVAVGISQREVSAAAAESLIASTAEAASAFRIGGGDGLSQEASRLAERELATMCSSTIAVSVVATSLVLVGLTVGLVGAVAQQPTQTDVSSSAIIPVNIPSKLSKEDDYAPIQLALTQKQTKRNPKPVDVHRDRAKYQAIDMKQRSEAEQRILAALDQATNMEFIETPLQDVVDFLKELHRVEIQLDIRALDAVGIGSDTPITRDLNNLSFRSVLRIMLRDLELTYLVRDEVLVITTLEEANKHFETHVYSLHRLGDVDPVELASVIQDAIRSSTWQPTDGKVSTDEKVRGSIKALPGAVVITQTQQAHEEIIDLLDQLQRLNEGERTLRRSSDE